MANYPEGYRSALIKMYPQRGDSYARFFRYIGTYTHEDFTSLLTDLMHEVPTLDTDTISTLRTLSHPTDTTVTDHVRRARQTLRAFLTDSTEHREWRNRG